MGNFFEQFNDHEEHIGPIKHQVFGEYKPFDNEQSSRMISYGVYNRFRKERMYFEGSVNILSKDNVYSGRVFTIENLTEQHENIDGEMTKPFTWTVCRRKPSVVALIHNVPTDEILLVEQFRAPVLNESSELIPYSDSGRILELVAGGLKDETPEECIKRESLEETGIQLGDVVRMQSFYTSPGGSDEFLYLFYAPVFSKTQIEGFGGGVEDENENTLVHWIAYDKALNMCRNGEFVDGKTILGILLCESVRQVEDS